MRIVILENDYHQAEQIERDIKAGFAPAEVNVDLIGTEYEFRQWLDQIAQTQPDIVILDVIVRWTDPSPEIPEAPRDVVEEGRYRAGLRCARLLRAKSPHTPFILYSLLEQSELSKELNALGWDDYYLTKETNVTPLIEKIRKLV